MNVGLHIRTGYTRCLCVLWRDPERQVKVGLIRRLWSHRAKRWRNRGWKDYPVRRLCAEFKLVRLVSLIPGLI